MKITHIHILTDTTTPQIKTPHDAIYLTTDLPNPFHYNPDGNEKWKPRNKYMVLRIETPPFKGKDFVDNNFPGVHTSGDDE